jgi:hypothetical protein
MYSFISFFFFLLIAVSLYFPCRRLSLFSSVLRRCECLYSVEWLSDKWIMSWKDLETGGRHIIEVMSRNLLGRTHRNHENPHSWLPVSRPRLEMNASDYKSKMLPPYLTLFDSSLMMYQTARRHIPEYSDIQAAICCCIWDLWLSPW